MKRSLIALAAFVALAVVIILVPGHSVHAGNNASTSSLSLAAGLTMRPNQISS